MNRTTLVRLASVAASGAAFTVVSLALPTTASAQQFGAPPPPANYSVQASGPSGGYYAGGSVRARVDSTTNPAEKFSHMGHLAISNDAAFQLAIAGTNATNSSTAVAFVLRPAADYFVIDNLSVGGFVRLGFANDAGELSGLNNGDNVSFGIGGRAGYNIPVAQNFSIWPRAGFSVNTGSADVPNTNVSVSNTTFALNLSCPFLVHPVDHYFLGLSPQLDADLAGTTRLTAFTINFVVGGWIL